LLVGLELESQRFPDDSQRLEDAIGRLGDAVSSGYASINMAA